MIFRSLSIEGFYIFSLFCTVISIDPKPYFSQVDRQNFAKIFEVGILKDDISSVHYSLAGLRLLKRNIERDAQKRLCESVKSEKLDGNIKTIYHVTEAIKLLEECPYKAPVDILNIKINEIIKHGKKPDAKAIFYAVNVANSFQIKVDHKLLINVLSILFNSGSISNYIYAFGCLSFLQMEQTKKQFHRIDDLLMQADEISGKILRFEGGLTFTGLAITSVYRLAKNVGKSPTFSAIQLVKFAEYFLSRRTVEDVRGAYFLLRSLIDLASDTFLTPTIVSFESPRTISKEKTPIILKVCNIIGEPLEINQVILDNVTHQISKLTAIHVKNVHMKQNDSDKTIYSMQLDGTKLRTGPYKLHFSVITQRGMFSKTETDFVVDIVEEYGVADVSFLVIDSVTNRQARFSIEPSQKFSKTLHLTKNQRISLNFFITNNSDGTRARAHQAFLIFTHLKTSKEVGFLAKYNAKDNTYGLTLNAKEFPGPNGKYNVWLIIGDKHMKNPLKWNLIDAFVDGIATKTQSLLKSDIKPDFEHKFTQKEGQNTSLLARTLAYLASILCAAPLFFVLVLWVLFGDVGQCVAPPNMWAAVVFHLSLGAVFLAYGAFWLDITNMIGLLKLVAFIALILFLTGNRILCSIHSERRLLQNNFEDSDQIAGIEEVIEESEEKFDREGIYESDILYHLEDFLRERGGLIGESESAESDNEGSANS
ncbi:oligosaccharyltransferase subunit ribophorin II domain-containing protein [Ditylenchus destructor]|nr:oligosaccharyltransferase subunit ribophorin II domain-containing protein [Ditylenchus destructor]